METTFSGQNLLPTMPVPKLNDTCHKLLEWATPLLTEQEQNETKLVINQFLRHKGEGELLQKDLNEWGHQYADSNWSEPVWQNLYLESRAPLVINSNVFYYLKSKLDENNESQSHIAAALISCVYQFITLIDTQTLTIDRQKNTPLCMNQYRNLFSSLRIPCQNTDLFALSSLRKHIIVMCNQHIYKVDILDEHGNIRSATMIEGTLNAILSNAQQGDNLGLLTTLPRDEWANQRTYLLELSEQNRETMTAIEEAAFSISLDQQAPEEITDISKQLLHGNGVDRFFDKSLQFIVFKNGKTGINFEHTGVDGSVMLRLNAHIYDTIDKVPFYKTTQDDKTPVTTDVEPMGFDLDSTLHQAIQSASTKFEQHIANTQTRVLNFTQFGKNQIKKFGVSPDSFVQLALQLAEHKLYGQCYSAYEAVMTRTFLGGRIDVLYTVSPESIAFIENIRSASCDTQTKIDSLIKASLKHIERANECRQGNGVYTHLLALQYRYKLAGKKIGINTLPELFTDKGYMALTQSIVCTSTTSEYGVNLAGYGPIVDDGYGIRYFTRNDSICFNMTSRTDMKDNLDQMQYYIEQSLLEMAQLMGNRD